MAHVHRSKPHVIVASALKEEGVWWTPVSEAKVRALMDVVAALPEGAA